MQYRLSRDPLVRDLLARGLARPGPLGLGFDAGERGALIGADGRPSTVLFTLGPPLKGLFWETTAAPEIREAAASLAARLAPRVSEPQRPSPPLSWKAVGNRMGIGRGPRPNPLFWRARASEHHVR